MVRSWLPKDPTSRVAACDAVASCRLEGRCLVDSAGSAEWTRGRGRAQLACPLVHASIHGTHAPDALEAQKKTADEEINWEGERECRWLVIRTRDYCRGRAKGGTDEEVSPHQGGT